MPTLNRSACSIEARKAASVWPESVRPLRSVIVTETITGSLIRRLVEQVVDGEQAGLEVERVEDGLGQEDIGAAVDQGLGLFVVGGREPVEVHGPIAGVVDVRRERGGAVRGADRTGDEGTERSGHSVAVESGTRSVPDPLGPKLIDGLSAQATPARLMARTWSTRS